MSQFYINSSGGGGGDVNSVNGTVNEITAFPTTGDVVLSIPDPFIAPGSISSTTNITAAVGLTVTNGDANIDNGNLTLPSTTSTEGQIVLNGDRFMHSFNGTTTTYLGYDAGNFSNTATHSTAIGYQSGFSLTSGGSNTLVGSQCGEDIEDGSSNCAFGWQSLFSNLSGNGNCAFGQSSLSECTGAQNAMFGFNSGVSIMSGQFNCGFGTVAFQNLNSGSSNVGLGFDCGNAYTGAESNNIIISNDGVAGESGAIRIGTDGVHTLCAIQGISGVTVTGAAVLCDTNGQLGTVVSSIRYKKNIEDLFVDNVLKLRPVSFNYKSNEERAIGLIAEEVEKIFPDLVIKNNEGLCETVKYHELPILLLSEIQKLSKRIDELEGKNAASTR